MAEKVTRHKFPFDFPQVKIKPPSSLKYQEGKPGGEDSSDAAADSSEEEPEMTQSILEQSLINWQNLQEWATRAWNKRYNQSVMSSAESVKPVQQQQQQQQGQQQQQQHGMQQQQQQHDEHGKKGFIVFF